MDIKHRVSPSIIIVEMLHGCSKEVATDECIDNIVKSMKDFPEDSYTQLGGLGFLSNISTIESIKARVKQVKVLPILANDVEVLRTTEEEKYEVACDTVRMYL